MSIEQFLTAVLQVGWPGVILIVLGYMGHRGIKGLVEWGKPIVDEVVSEHREFVRGVRVSVNEQSAKHDVTHARLDRIAGGVEEIKQKVSR